MAERNETAYNIRLQETKRDIQLLFNAGEDFRICDEAVK